MSLRERLSPIVLVLVAALVALLLGWLAPQHPGVALVAAGIILVLGVTALDAGLVPLLCLPLLYVVQRIGAGSVDLSVSDAALLVGTLPALLFGQRPYTPPVRALLWLTVVYQLSTLFTVIAHPYPAGVIEWFHEWFLIGGALLLGWAVGRGGHGPAGLRLMLMTACVLSGWVLLQATRQVLDGSFAPIYLPFGMHKNFLGTVIAITALIAYVRPVWLGLSRRVALASFWWLALGLAATQSRQAVVALGVALVVLVLRSRTDRRRSKAILLAVVPAMVVVLTLVRDQAASDNEFNSFNQRLTWFEDSLDIWSGEPFFGVGLRWWYTDRFTGGFQPPNAEIEVLTSAGVVGLLGFLVLMIGSVLVLWRVEPVYGTLALLAVLSRFVQGQLDLFWVAAQCSIPFAIAGICLGVQALHREDGTDPRVDTALPGHRGASVEVAPS